MRSHCTPGHESKRPVIRRIMRVGFTGTRKGMTRVQRQTVKALLMSGRATEFHHGDCVGADAEAHDVARELRLWVVVHPPTNIEKRAFRQGDETQPPRTYLTRNMRIVDDTEKIIAAPDGPERTRSGTWYTIRYAKSQNKPVSVVYPSGSVMDV
jgi:hypothetical protein